MTPAEYKAARLELGMRQGELADALGVSRATVNNREAGRRPVSEEAAMAIRGLVGKSTLDCALGLDQPWSTADVLRKLVDAAEILLTDKSYDGHGWEEIAGCVGYAKERLPHIEKLTAEYFQHNAGSDAPGATEKP